MTETPFPQRRPQAEPGPTRSPAAMSFDSYETRREVEASLAARQELGPEYSEHIAAGLAERVEQLAALRTAELRFESERESKGGSLEKTAQTQRFVTAIVSLGAGIPITAIAIVNGGLIETTICWAGIVGVNMAQALAGRKRR